MVYVENLNKWYGDFHAIKDLSFSAKKGEILGFLGPNGAGKSTSMKILSCFFQADSGEVIIDGLSAKKDSIEIRRRIGFLHESSPFYPEMTVESFICFMANMRGMSGHFLKKRLEYVLELFELGEIKKKPLHTLSKGYKQRVGFAQAIIHDPKVLILDEPTNGLDPNQIFELRKTIKELSAEKSIIFCSHILAEVSSLCEKILIIIAGRKVAFGNKTEISTNLLGGLSINLSLSGKNNITNKLKALKGIRDVSVTGGSYTSTDYRVLYDPKTDPRGDIFDLVIKNDLKICEMSSISLDLELIFRKLTQSKKMESYQK